MHRPVLKTWTGVYAGNRHSFWFTSVALFSPCQKQAVLYYMETVLWWGMLHSFLSQYWNSLHKWWLNSKLNIWAHNNPIVNIGDTKKTYAIHFCDQSLCDTSAVAMIRSPKEIVKVWYKDSLYGIKTQQNCPKSSKVKLVCLLIFL